MQFYSAHPGATNPEHSQVRYIVDNDIYLMLSAAYPTTPFTKFAVDNGAWTDHLHGLEFDGVRFVNYLKKLSNNNYAPEFIVLPDLFDNGIDSYNLSKEYLYLSDEYTCYLPIHEGFNVNAIESNVLDKIGGLFVGGNDKYRERECPNIVEFSHQIGLSVHIGRVGTLKKMVWCYNLGADSCDSSTFVRNKKEKLITKYLNICKEQRTL